MMSETSGWQPIETAPHDETDVLIWCGDDRPPVVAAYYEGAWLTYDTPFSEVGAAIFWHPLPAPPTTEDAEAARRAKRNAEIAERY